MRRGEIWSAHVGGKHRPVLVLTRSEVIDVRQLVTVAEVTTTARGLGVEVALDPDVGGLAQPSVVNCDGIHTIAQRALHGPLGVVDDHTLHQVCAAIGLALGC